jgi:pimeloyl-ACP methyl ester carboxylesterase
MNWLLIRGLGRDQKHWYKFPELLNSKFSDGKVITINLPGLNGESEPPMSINEITDYIRAKWLDRKESIQGDWSILAISLGGMIAIDWCDRYPHDFKKIAIINSSSKSTSSTFQRISPIAIKTILHNFMIKDPVRREKQVLSLITNNTKISNELLSDMVEVSNHMNLSKKTFFKQLFAASKFTLPEKLTIPLTVMTTKGDRFTSYKCSEAIAKRYNVDCHLHPDAGHDLPMDDPTWVLSKLN